ncbi:MAG: DHA2 family efflux MFS transporter permease subunit [Dokdonella sp.]|uniref:DHA2 family efflux MFS transporter permease subunit n=1 Tax=Dokdonella sp. TaxID=2291710 RepID=UPI0025BCC0B2|nr:DHA2 family efflux MFS transporter permease subunit [Dokdonella sp.]MBZ0222124.1 DHA2 family efflux MFS transporter permease subunit [Dokdonella sp.]MCC7254749.1 DHA2 family efflux MFS transporter permease subunit [Dokdonella sp.]
MAATPQEQAPLPPLHGAPLALLTVAIAFATFMEVLDITIVNVSVPHIAGSLGVSPQEGTWAISSYSLASAIMQPLSGWIGRQFGEVRAFCMSAFLFVLMSMLCGFATSMPMLVVGRLLQGAGSGPMVALSLSLLLNNYPIAKKGLALALWAMTVVVAPIFGPILGGWLTDNYSWPWIFFINAPVGLLAAIITWYLLRHRESRIVKTPIDKVGLALLVVGVGCLQFMLDNGNDKDWFSSPLIITLAIIAVVCLTFLIAWELTDKHPIVDLSLFKKRNFVIGVSVMSFGMVGFFGINVVYPLWLQVVLGYTASWAGLATAPVGVLAFLLSPLIGRNIDRLELRSVVTFAFIVFAATSYWFSLFPDNASFNQLLWPRFVMGMAIPCFFIPLNQVFLSGLKPHEIASASGLANFCRTIAASISTAVTVTMWQHRGDYHHAVLAEHITGTSAATQSWVQGLGGDARAWQVIENLITQQSLTLAVNDVFWACAILFVLMIPLVWLARPPFGNVAAGPGGH